MLLSNLQDNIGKAPMVAAGQAAVHAQRRAERHTQNAERLEQARQAEEQIRQLHESENETIREELAHPPVDRDGRRRQGRRQAEPNEASEAAEGDTDAASPPPATDDDHHIDITI